VAARHDVWEQIRRHLETAKDRIFREIQAYPSPIAACDAQLTFLCDERDRIAAEIGRMEAILGSGTASRDVAAAEAFMRTSPCFDVETRRSIFGSC
jgi:hypothetical protein